jgi:hypothetical protein
VGVPLASPTQPGAGSNQPGVGQRAGETYDKGQALYNFFRNLFNKHPPQERSPCFPYGPLTQAMPFRETSSPQYYRDRIKGAYKIVFGADVANRLSDEDVKNIFLRYWAPRCESYARGRRYSPDPAVAHNVWTGEAAEIRRNSQKDFENLLRQGPIDSGTAPNYGGHGGEDPRSDPNAPWAYHADTGGKPTFAGFGGLAVLGLIAALFLLGPKLAK